MQDIRKKRRALMSEADALFDLLETERAVLADYAATLCEGGPHMLGDELVRLFLEASEDARAVAAELALRAAPRPARADAVEGVVRAVRRIGKDVCAP